MKKYFVTPLVVILLMAFLTIPDVTADTITNGGFEGGLSSWSTWVQSSPNGTVAAVGHDSVNAYGVSYAVDPKIGTKMAKLEGDGSSKLWQTFSAGGDVTISFWYNMFAYDWPTKDDGPDYLKVYIDGVLTLDQPINAPVSSNITTGWQYFSTVVNLESGTHTLMFYNANWSPDGANNPFLATYIDGVTVPEPSIILLLIISMMSVAGLRKCWKE